MATKPTNIAEWGTGAAPIVEPSTPQKQAGWPVDYKPPAQWFNWWMKLVHLWIVWLDAFESDPHTWTALQTFNAKIVSTWGGGGSAVGAIHGNNTSAGVGGFPGVLGESTNGIGVSGNGLIAGVAGSIGVLAGASAAGVSGQSRSTDPLAYGGLFEAIDGGIGLRAQTSGTSPGTGLQVAGGGFYGIEVLGANTLGVDIVSSSGAVGSAGLRTLGGLTGVYGRPKAGVVGTGVKGDGQTTGPGVHGVGGGTSGDGLRGVGGAPNGVGARLSGTGDGQGLVSVGGTGTTGVGGEFGRGDSDSTKPAINCVGAIALLGATDVAGAVAIQNQLHRKLLIRAWALVQLNNSAAPTILDSMNIASVSQVTAGNGVVNFTMAQAMANTNYGVLRDVDSNISNARTARVSRTSTTQFGVEIYDPSAPATVLTAVNSNNFLLFVAVVGAQ